MSSFKSSAAAIAMSAITVITGHAAKAESNFNNSSVGHKSLSLEQQALSKLDRNQEAFEIAKIRQQKQPLIDTLTFMQQASGSTFSYNDASAWDGREQSCAGFKLNFGSIGFRKYTLNLCNHNKMVLTHRWSRQIGPNTTASGDDTVATFKNDSEVVSWVARETEETSKVLKSVVIENATRSNVNQTGPIGALSPKL